MRFVSASGGAKGRPAGACAPSVNPCAPVVPDWQAVVTRQCSTSFSHFTVQFYPIPHLRTTKRCAPGASTPVLGPRPPCPLRIYGAPLVLQQEQTFGAATPLIARASIMQSALYAIASPCVTYVDELKRLGSCIGRILKAVAFKFVPTRVALKDF